jgi:lipoprotein-releasing system ATP-binding protein
MVLELKNIDKTYSTYKGEVEVLKSLSFRAEKGESVAITGPSGCGKTTLLNCMGLLDTPNRGSVFLDGIETSLLKEKELSHIRNRRIGFVFQLHYLLPQCTVLENVLLPSLVNKKENPPGIVKRAKDLLARLGMENAARLKPYALSGGERQRTAIARALVLNPAIILLDEPTGALDDGNASNIGALLGELNREEGITFIIVTHSRDLAGLMDSRYILRHGALEKTGGRP